MSIRTVIVDDEGLARERVRQMLGREPDIEVVADCASGREAVERIKATRPDLLILDVQMPEMDGFGVLRELTHTSLPLTIFITAYDQYALQAFDVHALDYLLKPVDPDRFRVAIERARASLSQQDAVTFRERLIRLAGAAAQLEVRPDSIMVRSGRRTLFIRVSEIDWIESAGNYVRIHHRDGAHLLRETMTGIEKRLPREHFARIQRSVIVHLDRVAEIRQDARNRDIVVLRSGHNLPLSATYRPSLERALGRL
jgi:two-component system LytT family response regulator